MDYSPPKFYPPPANPDSPPPQNHSKLISLMGSRNGVVGTVERAIQLGELLCEFCYSAEELALQRPLNAVADGEIWRIEGSRNPEGIAYERGPFQLSIWRYDGRILDINVTIIMLPIKLPIELPNNLEEI